MGFLTGKTAIITGAGRAVLSDGSCGSIGYGIATAFAKEGANLVITGRNVKKLEEAKNELEAKYHKVQAENWRHRAKQLKAANLTLHHKVLSLQGHVNWYRSKCRELKEENDLLRSKLARYAELERALSEGRG